MSGFIQQRQVFEIAIRVLAFELYRQIASETGDESLVGIANTCYGGMIEADVALGRRSPADALAELTAGLDVVRDVDDGLVGDRLES